jgi:hypothetical protein
MVGQASLPEIEAITGNGSNACASLGPTGVACIADGLRLFGSNLLGAQLELSSGRASSPAPTP